MVVSRAAGAAKLILWRFIPSTRFLITSPQRVFDYLKVADMIAIQSDTWLFKSGGQRQKHLNC